MLIGWQIDNLPQFSHIESIVSVESLFFLCVNTCETKGIDRHFHSYVIVNKGLENVVCLRNLDGQQPVCAHSSNSNLYITLRSHVMNT